MWLTTKKVEINYRNKLRNDCVVAVAQALLESFELIF
jgi:hypothetical protein